MTFIPLSVVVSVPETKKYLNRDGLEEYNSLLPHSSGEMQEYVNDWLDEHPEATTTVQDGAITEPKLADKSVSLRTLADDTVHMLKGMMLTREISGDILTADDAYSAPPVSLTVDGKSTQDGTPTPESPIEIVSLEQVTLHASADGATDAANWPVLLSLTTPLRSLPDGTKDTLDMSYLRPSAREGWAWYSAELVQNVGEIGTSNNFNVRKLALQTDGTISFLVISGTGVNPGPQHPISNIAVLGGHNTGKIAIYYGDIYMRFSQSVVGTTKDTIDAYLNEHCVLLYYLRNPITTQLDPIELPVLPAPDVTVWSDPSTGLQMRYVRDTNIVIQRIEEAIADQ